MFQEIVYRCPLSVFTLFAEQPGALFLDSAQLRPGCGRYSFIALDPFLVMTSKNGHIELGKTKLEGNPFQILKEKLAKYTLKTQPDLPPFQGGVAGFFGYELAQHLEKLPVSLIDDMQFPDLALGFYDLVIGFDTAEKRAWIFSSGYPEQTVAKRKKRAKERFDILLNQLNKLHDTVSSTTTHIETSIKSNFTSDEYQRAVQTVIEYILSGDIFEANISQRFRVDFPGAFNPFGLYQKLRMLNPAPFAAYINLADTVIASASPERFLKLSQGNIETRPIKGTRRRGKNKNEDEKLAQELISSEKDHAENVMIVDLMRNDLSRVCEAHSVKVPQLCGLESYATVHHLVSIITGKLRSSLNAIDLLCASFPGGSITGAPKIRAMEIIAEIEPTQRGPYCGSVGYIGFNGDMDSSIIIRTFAIKNNVVTFQAGGAVVADSHPLDEYLETLTKASALKRALIE